MPSAVNSTHAAVVSADGLAARSTRSDFVARKDDMRLHIALSTMFLARETAATVSAAQVLRAVDLLVHGAYRLVICANRLLTCRAAHHLVPADRLVAASFAKEGALATQ